MPGMMNPAIITAPTSGGGLLNTAANYPFPLTSGLLGSLGGGSLGSAPPGVPNYSEMALQMAGNPHAGPYAPVPIPSGAGIPGAPSSGSGSSGLAGLLTTAAQNPGLVKNAASGLSGLLGGVGPGDTVSSGALNSALSDSGLASTATNDATFQSALANDAAAQTGSALGDVAGGAAAAPAAISDLGLAGGGTGGIDTMALAQQGYASLGGVPGSLAATDTSAGAAGGSGLLGAAGPYIAAAVPLALAAYGASQPGAGLGSTWYNNFGNTLSAGMGANATPEQKLQASSMLQQLGLMQANGTGGGTGFSTASNFDFGRLMDVLKPYGVTNLQQAQALANQLINSIPAGQMPTANSHPLVHTA